MSKLALPPVVHVPDPAHPIPGAGHRHWHEAEEEMVYVLAGKDMRLDDTEAALRCGVCGGWPAGGAVGRRPGTRSTAPASCLVAGARNRTAIIHHSDPDLITPSKTALRAAVCAPLAPNTGGTHDRFQIQR